MALPGLGYRYLTSFVLNRQRTSSDGSTENETLAVTRSSASSHCIWSCVVSTQNNENTRRKKITNFL